MKSFASDNYAGAHPAVLDALLQVNVDHVPSYGDDPYTEAALAALGEHFGTQMHARFVFNGTAANILCLSALLAPWDAVIAARTAHINTDECGAPERVAGIKVITVDTPDGKLTPELIAPTIESLQGFQHARQPKVVSISNVSELGTVYTPAETRELAEYVHSRNMYLHVDGARLANAAAAQGVGLADLTTAAGVDALSLGGTKNGMLCGEAALWFGAAASAVQDNSFMLCKASAMLGSKTRFLSAQFSALYGSDLWQLCATQANTMAARLARGLPDSCTLAYAPDANEVFAHLPKDSIAPLQQRFHFYTWQEGSADSDCVRWVTSWDTRPEEVDALLDDLTSRISCVGGYVDKERG
ncbi:MAG: aminotransferase class I/II-fold pyridoxal phosphate-dependent enzyme [Coriobacteriia bacterium]|nr:aminotransferase class I/II-fold pyridoxal phosphate-dependent enzyme [Coriobacteriia bacterium]